jgi:hypothetical protein
MPRADAAGRTWVFANWLSGSLTAVSVFAGSVPLLFEPAGIDNTLSSHIF